MGIDEWTKLVVILPRPPPPALGPSSRPERTASLPDACTPAAGQATVKKQTHASCVWVVTGCFLTSMGISRLKEAAWAQINLEHAHL